MPPIFFHSIPKIQSQVPKGLQHIYISMEDYYSCAASAQPLPNFAFKATRNAVEYVHTVMHDLLASLRPSL